MKKTIVSLYMFLATGAASAQLIVPDVTQFKASVEPLLTTTWDQGAPYNSLTPTKTNILTGKRQNTPVGCVALALGQIMYYHRYPEMGQGRNAYKSFFDADSLIAEFGQTEYRWDRMLESYTYNYSSANVQAVATLLFHCGVAVGTIYQASGSSAFAYGNIPKDLVDYFRYEPDGIRYLSRSDYGKQEWMELIYNELSNGRPIFYSGNSASQGGHAWVLDGYDAEGRVHINWGWKGSHNGYYDIDLTDTAHDFNRQQAMVIGIQPKQDQTSVASVPQSVEGGERVAAIYALDGTPLPQPRKGLNLVRYDDGTIRKVIVR